MTQYVLPGLSRSGLLERNYPGGKEECKEELRVGREEDKEEYNT